MRLARALPVALSHHQSGRLAASPVAMTLLSTEMERLLAAAAELRAAGNSWEAVAAKLRCSAATCRRWPARHRRRWDELYTAAEQQQVREARAEATGILRTQLRLDDPKEKRDAAKALLSFAVRTSDAAPEPAGDPHEVLVAGMSDPQVKEATDACQETLRPSTAG